MPSGPPFFMRLAPGYEVMSGKKLSVGWRGEDALPDDENCGKQNWVSRVAVYAVRKRDSIES